MLSLRAQGDPKDAKPGAEDVNSHMTGKFQMGDGKLALQDLELHPAWGDGSNWRGSTRWTARNSISAAR